MKEAAVQKIKNAYPEIEDIGKDINALKADVGQFATHLKDDKLAQLSDKAHKEYENLQALRVKLEKRIKENPTQSLAIAFAGGLLASLIFGRR